LFSFTTMKSLVCRRDLFGILETKNSFIWLSLSSRLPQSKLSFHLSVRNFVYQLKPKCESLSPCKLQKCLKEKLVYPECELGSESFLPRSENSFKILFLHFSPFDTFCTLLNLPMLSCHHLHFISVSPPLSHFYFLAKTCSAGC
jgi:hypothetical protein